MRILISMHASIEPAALFASELEKAGFAFDIVQVKHEPMPDTLDGYAGMLVMGGPQSANDDLPYIRAEQKLLQEAIGKEMPVLGICLGAQMLAKVAGGTVYRSPRPEHGWFTISRTDAALSDPLFSAMESEMPIFQWHGETFTLPEGAVLLATNPEVPHQAFRIGSNQYGLQFHAEVSEAVIRRWIEHGSDDLAYLPTDAGERMLAEARDKLPVINTFCCRLTAAWAILVRNYVLRKIAK